MLYGHRCGNAYFGSYVENIISCITCARKNLGLIIVDDNRLIRLIYIWFLIGETIRCTPGIFEHVHESMRRCVTACI